MPDFSVDELRLLWVAVRLDELNHVLATELDYTRSGVDITASKAAEGEEAELYREMESLRPRVDAPALRAKLVTLPAPGEET